MFEGGFSEIVSTVSEAISDAVHDGLSAFSDNVATMFDMNTREITSASVNYPQQFSAVTNDVCVASFDAPSIWTQMPV